MTTKVRFTRRDLELWPDDGKRRELIDGELYEMPSQSPRHQGIVGCLVYAVMLYLEARPLGEILIAPLDVLLPGEDTVQPDLIYVPGERAAIATERGIEGVPDWVVEVLSPSNREYDLKTKRALYSRVGVPVHWVVDPKAQKVRAWEGDSLTAYRSGEIARVSLLPGFGLPLEELFGSR